MSNLIEIKKSLAKDPLNAALHYQYSSQLFAKKSIFLAYAEIKTAIYLGQEENTEVKQYLNQIEQHIGDLQKVGFPKYARTRLLANQIKALKGNRSEKISILDVGGGDGILSTMLRSENYCLAEPTVNGISGEKLPFKAESFDIVVSCHVLEHIPSEQRTLFLDSLFRSAKSHVVLINPFNVAGTYPLERMTLTYEITRANWVKEHLDCSLPDLSYVEQYCQNNNYHYETEAVDNTPLLFTYILAEYYAHQCQRGEEFQRVNKFFNSKYLPQIDNEQLPTQYMVSIAKDKTLNTCAKNTIKKENKIKLSVLCITYNHEPFIAQCLESILEQETNFEFELLIYDDISTDGTVDIIKEFQAKDSRIKLIQPEENQFQKGIRGLMVKYLYPLAQGEYLALSDGDDYFTDMTKLQQQVDFLDAHPDHAVCFHPVRVTFDTPGRKDIIFPGKKAYDRGFTLKNLIYNNFIQTNSVMYRRQEDYSDISQANFMPYDWYQHIYHARCGKIGMIPKVMSTYRKHANGVWYFTSLKDHWRRNGDYHMQMTTELIRLFPDNPAIKIALYEKLATYAQDTKAAVAEFEMTKTQTNSEPPPKTVS